MAVSALPVCRVSRSTGMEAKLCAAVEGVKSQNVFWPLKKKTCISLSVHYIYNIFSTLPCRHTALSFGITFSQP